MAKTRLPRLPQPRPHSTAHAKRSSNECSCELYRLAVAVRLSTISNIPISSLAIFGTSNPPLILAEWRILASHYNLLQAKF